MKASLTIEEGGLGTCGSMIYHKAIELKIGVAG